jgi:branched-chain amino acid transport system permease protein
MEFWITQAFNGISYGALLFLLASGLSLIFGVMRIVNLAHGSYFLLGGYVGLTTVWRTGNFPLALLSGALAVALIGIGMERLFLRRLQNQVLAQVLMTMGFALIFQDLALLIWGGDPYTIPVPGALSGALRLGVVVFPIYRLFIIGAAGLVGVALWLLLEKTRVGAAIRAAVDDGEMAEILANERASWKRGAIVRAFSMCLLNPARPRCCSQIPVPSSISADSHPMDTSRV